MEIIEIDRIIKNEIFITFKFEGAIYEGFAMNYNKTDTTVTLGNNAGRITAKIKDIEVINEL